MQYLILHRQAERICFIGHATGCQDICHFLRNQFNNPFWQELYKQKGIGTEVIAGAVLQAPISDREQAASRDPEAYRKNLQLATNMCQAGAGQEFMPRSAFWVPITAQRFVDMNKIGGLDDYFASDSTADQLAERLQAAGDWPNLRILVAFSGADELLPPNTNLICFTGRLTAALNTKKPNLAKSLYLPMSNHDLSESGVVDIF